MDVPDFFSARRARFMSGLGRKALAKLPRHGYFRQISREDLERRLLRTLTAADWDSASVEISRTHLARKSRSHTTEDADARH